VKVTKGIDSKKGMNELREAGDLTSQSNRESKKHPNCSSTQKHTKDDGSKRRRRTEERGH